MLRIKQSTLIVRNYHLFIIFMLVFNALIFSPRLEMVLGILLRLHQQANIAIFKVERLRFSWGYRQSLHWFDYLTFDKCWDKLSLPTQANLVVWWS